MMTKTHTASATYIAMLSYDYLNKNILLLSRPLYFVLGSFIGSAFPDIDIPTSKIGTVFFPISYIINKFWGHRTITHSILGSCAFTYLVFKVMTILNIPITIKHELIVGLIFGYVIHMTGDIMTDKGIPLFYPLSKRIRFPITFPTGKFAEWIVMGILLIGIFVESIKLFNL